MSRKHIGQPDVGATDRSGKHKSNNCSSRGQSKFYSRPSKSRSFAVFDNLVAATVPESRDWAIFVLTMTTTTTTDKQINYCIAGNANSRINNLVAVRKNFAF